MKFYLSLMCALSFCVQCKSIKRREIHKAGVLAEDTYMGELEGFNALAKMKRNQDNFELLSITHPETPILASLKLNDLQITYGSLNNEDGLYPLVSVHKELDYSFVEYTLCQERPVPAQDVCVTHFDTRSEFEILPLWNFEEKKPIHLKLRVCVENDQIQGDTCSAWVDAKDFSPSDIYFESSENTELIAQLKKAEELSYHIKNKALSFFTLLQKHKQSLPELVSKSWEPIFMIGNHRLAEAMVSQIYGQLSQNLCYDRSEYNSLNEQEQCRLDKAITQSRFAKPKDGFYWNQDILCSDSFCTHLIGCASKIEVSVYTSLSSGKCLRPLEYLSYQMTNLVSALGDIQVSMDQGQILQKSLYIKSINLGLGAALNSLILDSKFGGYEGSDQALIRQGDSLRADLKALKIAVSDIEKLLHFEGAVPSPSSLPSP